MAKFKGTAGDDNLTGTSGNDKFNLAQGGNDTASGGDGNDVFTMGATLNAADRIDGGNGTDVVDLKGDYSAGLVFDAATIVNVEKINVFAGFDYSLTLNDGNVAAGARLTVNAGALNAGNHLIFDGSAESDGSFAITGGADSDTLTGGALRDTFNLAKGGDDIAHGGGGNDTFTMGGALNAADQIDGGAGSDVLVLDGNYSGTNAVTFGATTVTNVETISFAAGHAYGITTSDATVAAGATMTVDGSALASNNALTFNGAAETDGSFVLIGGAGNDVLSGGNAGNVFDLTLGGRDTANGGQGNNIFELGGAFDSTDRINGALGASNTLVLNGAYFGLTVTNTMVTNVQTVDVQGTNTASIVWKVSAPLTLDASAAGGSLTFDFSAVSSALHFIGGALNTQITGGTSGDTFDAGSGVDIFIGGQGNDTFNFGAGLTAADQVDGGAGADTLNLNGDYSGGVVFGAATMVNVETLRFSTGHDYNITTDDANVAAGQTLTVDASALMPSRHLIFNGGAETNGSFAFTGGAGADTLTGGANADSFNLSLGGNDTAHGGGGNDAFTMGAALGAGDSIDGGTGSDALVLNGDYSGGVTLGAATITNIETLQFSAGHSYNFTTNDGNVASGATLTVDGSALGAGDVLTFNGSKEMDGSFSVLDGAGNDVLTGGAQADGFDLSHGGNDIAHGGAGDDTFILAAAFTAADSIDGGTGSDTLVLNGNYSGGVVFGAATMTNIETLQLATGHSYNLTTDDGNVASGATLTVDASALGAANVLTFNGVAEANGSFAISAGAGNDSLTGGALADSFDLSHGGNDTAHGGGGNDTFTFGAALTAADSIDGGTGSDTLVLNGDYSGGVTLGAATITNIETLQFSAGNSYNLTTNNGNVASGQTLTVDASALGAGDTLTFNGAAETDGFFSMTGGAGNDSLTGGALADNFDLSHGGNDTAHGGGGNDTFTLGAALTAADSIDGGTGSDTLVFNGDYSGGVVFGAATMTNIETLQFSAGHNYNLTTNDASVASGATLTVDASALGAGDSLVFNGAAENDGFFSILDGAGNDTLTGGANADGFDLSHGGNDTAHGSGGNDTFALGAMLTSADSIDGGTGSDTLVLNGDYSGGVTLGAATITNIETLQFSAGHSYNFTTNDGNVASGQTLTVNASALGAIDGLAFDGSAETNGSFAFTGGAGNDVLTGGALADSFDLSHGGNDTAQGGGGTDTFTLGAALAAADSIDGGAGSDTLILNGDYSGGVTFAAATITNIETLQLAAGHSYNLTTDDGNIASGQTLTVNATALGAGNTLTFNGAAETDGFFSISGGAGSDTIAFGANLAVADTINGGAGSDTLSLNGDYSGGFTFGAATMTNIETLQLLAGSSYNLATNDANVASGATLIVDASALGANDLLTFNGTAESNGSFSFLGGAGDDVLTGGAQGDSFDLTHTGNDTAHGGGGNDTFTLGATLTAADSIDGGAGSDTLSLNGNYSGGLTFGATTMVNVETLQLAAGHSYSLATDDGNVASGQTLTVDASALSGSDALTFDGAAESDGGLIFKFGGNFAAGDQLTGGTATQQIMVVVAETVFNSTLELNGDYSGGFIFGANAMSNIGVVKLDVGHSYNLTTDDANVAAGQFMLVNASALGSSNVLTFNGSAETDGAFDVQGGAGNDVLTGGALGDIFDLSFGGNDTAHGGAGNDTFYMGAAFTAADAIDGGSGSLDILSLAGNYSAGVTFGAGTMTNIDQISLASGNSYKLTTNDANLAAGATLSVNAAALVAGNILTFSGAAETDGFFALTGGAGNDALTGGAQADTFDLSFGGNDTVHGGGGNDVFTLGATLTSADSIDGGTGSDTLVLNGSYSGGLTLGAATMTNIETLQLAAGHGYNLTTNNANVATGQTLTVDATALTASDSLTFVGSAESDGHFVFETGAGTYHLTGGTQSDTFDVGASFSSGDSVNGGAGDDVLAFNGAYSAGFTVTSAMASNIATVTFANGHNYSFVWQAAIGPAEAAMTVDASAMDGSTTFTFDGSGLSGSGSSAFIAGGGVANLTGGSGADDFDLANASSFFVHGGGGNDTFHVGGNYTGTDLIDGGPSGAEVNTVVFDGDYSGGLSLVAGTSSGLNNIATLVFDGGHSYDVQLDGMIYGANHSVTVDASALQAGDTFSFDASLGSSFEFHGDQGTYHVTGSNDSDAFFIGAGFTTADSIDGGANIDTLFFTGDYSAGLVLDPNTITSVETINFTGGFDYNITTDDATVAAGQTLIVKGGTGGATNQLIFDGSAETDGQFTITDSAGNDVLTGGALNDTFIITNSGVDTVHAGAGDDIIDIGDPDLSNPAAVLTAADSIDGGDGNDVLNIKGDYSAGLVLGASTLTGIETLNFKANNSYNLTTNDATVAAGQTLTVNAGTLAISDSFTFNGSAETDGSFVITSGLGNNVLSGGALADTFDISKNGNTQVTAGGGADIVYCSASGGDSFYYGTVSDSTDTAFDVLNNFNAQHDKFHFTGLSLLGIEKDGGTINLATLAGDINAVLGENSVTANIFVITATGGDENGNVFLVVDENQNRHYDAGTDYLIELATPTHMSSFGSGNFLIF